MNKNYYGWANHETWCVRLWLTNDETMLCHWQERAAELLIAFGENRSEADNSSKTLNELAIVLGTEIGDFMQASDTSESCGTDAERRRGALGEVNWHEVALSFLNELLPPTNSDSASDLADNPGALFPLGRTFITPGVKQSLNPEQIRFAIVRHARGDWGLVGVEDARANELALKEGGRLLSVYEDESHTRYWVITEADRSMTTVLLPIEY